MRELLELQTGQVAFISGLMAGFSLSIAVQILRYGIINRRAQAVFLLFLLCTFLFVLALYVDVRLSIELAGYESVPADILQRIALVRNLGTGSATVALVLFIVAIGSLGWLVSTTNGIMTTLVTGATFYCLWSIWTQINLISVLLSKT